MAEDFVRQPHWAIAENLGLIDPARGRAVAGPRFTLLRGWGARLERALANWMLDLHTTQHGYTEIAPPLIASTQALQHTGHLPHFQQEMYAIAPHADAANLPTLSQDEQGSAGEAALWLNPTAEVPLVAMHAGALLAERHLPIAEVAGMVSFRREAGSAGRATRGLLRLHQFTKVELTRLTTPAGANEAFDAITHHAEAVLTALALPFRTVALAPSDLGFAATRGRDIVVWFAGMGQWIEVASISDCGTFQARLATIRYKPTAGGKPRFVHTLNGSGLAVGRTLAALLEQHQLPDGGVAIPPVLRPYLGGVARIP
jgi:seryl-tRNA synthetase